MKSWAENWAKEMRYLRYLPPTPRPEKPNPTVRVSRRPVTELVVHINGVETAHAEVGARDQQINDYHGRHDHSLIIGLDSKRYPFRRWTSREYPTPDQRAASKGLFDDVVFPPGDIATEIAPIYFGWYDQTPPRSRGWSVQGVQEPPWWRRKQKQEEEQ